jgi:UDP-glucose 4-epimerase
MKVLIIGSKGFIGSACYNYLKKQPGFDVYGADVAAIYDDEKYFIVDSSNADFKEIFKRNQFDWCINCAGAASVPDSFTNPLRDYLLNVHHTVQLLNAIKDENATCKFIQLSSAAVYGNPQVLPITEHHPLKPLSPYGVHKKQAEELCHLYHNYFGLSTYVVRIFSAYGAGLKKQLFWDLYKKTQSAGNLVLLGTGNETREFIHVSDIVNALVAIMLAPNNTNRVINVANNDAITIAQAAGVFLKNIGFTGKVAFNGINRPGDPLYWQADIALLQTLGYRQKTSFEDGIIDYCKWLKEKE